MAQRVGILNGSNLMQDKDVGTLIDVLTNSTSFVVGNGLAVTLNSISAGKCLIKCTRTSTTPNETVWVAFENTAAVVVDTSGTKKFWVAITQANINDGTLNTDPTGASIGAIATGAAYPATNFIPLASIAAGVITDARPSTTISGVTINGLLKHSLATPIASATTTDLSTVTTGNEIHITGTNTITGFGTVAAGVIFDVVFDGILTLTYNASSLIIPGSTSITTATGDTMKILSEGSGNWRVLFYQKRDGSSLVQNTNRTIGGTGSDGALSIAAGTTTLTLVNDYIEKNYSSIAISGSALLDITGVSGSNGGIAYIKCSGNFTMSAGNIQMNGQWGAGGAAKSGLNQAGGNGSQGKSVMAQILVSNFGVGGPGSSFTGGAGAAAVTQVNPYYGFPKSLIAACGAGGASGSTSNSGSPVGGAGWRGGGILIIEVGGAINFSGGTIKANGADGTAASNIAAGGGGGGGGTIIIVYNTLTSVAGTTQTNGGVGGAGSGGGGAVGGGGGGWITAGGAGGQGSGASGTAGTNGTYGTGGAGGSGAGGNTGGWGGGAGLVITSQAALY